MRKAKMITLMAGLLLMAASALLAQEGNPLTGINIVPNPMEKFCSITLSFNQPVNIGVNIETEQGTVIKTIYWGPAGTGHTTFTWDRIDDNGLYVPAGEYVVVVNHNTRYTSTKKTLILK
jgi:flagellar hook assembly protein FlgD